MRSLNQLGKLIHDGRVAISGAPAGQKPVDAPAQPEGVKVEPKAGPAPETRSIDVTKRASLPDPSKQRDAEKLVRELFKEQYSKKTPAERRVLARVLLQETSKSQGDTAALWVLCKETIEAASQGCDVKSILDAADLAGRSFDVDMTAMKSAGLTAAAKTAKTPEECAALADAMNSVIDDCVAADQYDAAEKMSIAALPIAKRANNNAMATRAATRLREVSEAKILYQALKGVLEILAKNSENAGANLEMGQYLCYVKGSWELGLRFMVKGSDPAIQQLVQRELGQPDQAAERVDLADSWSGMGEKEKSPLRKSQMLLHAKTLYESALPDAQSLLKTKIEKRIAALDMSPADRATIDLLKSIDTTVDTLKGAWIPGPEGRVTALKGQALLQVPYLVPDEYDVKIVIIPTKGAEIYVGLVVEKVQFDVAVDGWAGTISGIGSIDGKMANGNETSRKGQVLKTDAPNTILCAVRRNNITVSVNGDRIVSWKAEPNRLSMNNFWSRPITGTIALGSWIPYSVTKLELTPVTGRGKPLR